jgi:hypothetical protein
MELAAIVKQCGVCILQNPRSGQHQSSRRQVRERPKQRDGLWALRSGRSLPRRAIASPTLCVRSATTIPSK